MNKGVSIYYEKSLISTSTKLKSCIVANKNITTSINYIASQISRVPFKSLFLKKIEKLAIDLYYFAYAIECWVVSKLESDIKEYETGH